MEGSEGHSNSAPYRGLSSTHCSRLEDSWTRRNHAGVATQEGNFDLPAYSDVNSVLTEESWPSIPPHPYAEENHDYVAAHRRRIMRRVMVHMI